MLKRAILITAYGTNYENEALSNFEKDIKQGFPEFYIRRAFTSDSMRKHLKEREIIVESPYEALCTLSEDGFGIVYIMPAFITPDKDYDRVANAKEYYEEHFYELKLSSALLQSKGDYEKLCSVLMDEYKADDEKHAYVFVRRDKSAKSDEEYNKLQKLFDKKASGFHILREGEDELEDLSYNLKKNSISEISLVPFSMWASSTDDKESGSTNNLNEVLSGNGFNVNTIEQGLEGLEAVRDLLVDKLKSAVGD